MASAERGADRGQKGKQAPAVIFKTPEGGDISLTAFKGRPILVNLWASWCAPCVKELPTLDKLAATRGEDGRLTVIAVSQDSGPQASVAAFLAKLDLQELGGYHDPEMKLSDALGIKTMPTTILYGGDGREIWRYVGDLDWTGAEAKTLLAEAK